MKSNLKDNGFEIIENIYSEKEINQIIELINSKELENQFGVRE
jgi:hypothetical protein